MLHTYAQLGIENSLLGFVPTMGALHQGHLHLINTALAQCDWVVCSVFVNPSQFNDPADYENYPRTKDQDLDALSAFDKVLAYFPEKDELYPPHLPKLLDYNDPALFGILEGSYRPGHFQGVVTVVIRLLKQVAPNKAFFGLKDYQQYLVIKKAASLLLPMVQILGVETVRSVDGLALSSRNQRLGEKALHTALNIGKALRHIAFQKHKIPLDQAIAQAAWMLEQTGFETDYLCVCLGNNLLEVTEWPDNAELIALCAAKIDGVRLIDNLLF